MLKSFNDLMDYIEDNLTKDIDSDVVSKITGVSDYHFRRMFSFMAGMSLTDYIKQRRLASANVQLVAGAKVTDVAYEYGYSSVEGFSRAFRDWSGYLPSEVVKTKFQKSFPKFIFFIDIKGGVSMEFRIEEKEKFNLVGVTKRVPIQFEGVNNTIMELAMSITDRQYEEMHELADLAPHGVLNISYNFDEGYLEEKGELTHMIGFASSQENPYEDLEQIEVAKSLWAIFPSTGPFPQVYQQTHADIYGQWLPSSDYELVDLPSISYIQHEGTDENKYSEIWVAVKKK